MTIESKDFLCDSDKAKILWVNPSLIKLTTDHSEVSGFCILGSSPSGDNNLCTSGTTAFVNCAVGGGPA